jgi:hypothetical protein
MSPINGFLLKDIMLFGAALFTCAEALREAKQHAMSKRSRREMGVS